MVFVAYRHYCWPNMLVLLIRYHFVVNTPLCSLNRDSELLSLGPICKMEKVYSETKVHFVEFMPYMTTQEDGVFGFRIVFVLLM